VAALAGVRDCAGYEGQAAMELEWLASGVAPDGCYPFDLIETPSGRSAQVTWVIDTRPLIAAVARDVCQGLSAALVSRRFHSTLVAMIARVCGRLREQTGLETVVLSGGVFLNALLTEEVSEQLRLDGFLVLRHRQVPPNDGGLSLGQLAIAAAWLAAPLADEHEYQGDWHVPRHSR
jgi:hydrogenase maturation protein HypF